MLPTCFPIPTPLQVCLHMMCVCVRVASHSSKSHSLNYTIHDSQFCHVEGCSSNKINKTMTGFNLLKTKIKVLQITLFFIFFISPNFHCSIVQYILVPLAQSWSKMRLWMTETDCCTAEKIFPNLARTTTTSDHKT